MSPHFPPSSLFDLCCSPSVNKLLISRTLKSSLSQGFLGTMPRRTQLPTSSQTPANQPPLNCLHASWLGPTLMMLILSYALKYSSRETFIGASVFDGKVRDVNFSPHKLYPFNFRDKSWKISSGLFLYGRMSAGLLKPRLFRKRATCWCQMTFRPGWALSWQVDGCCDICWGSFCWERFRWPALQGLFWPDAWAAVEYNVLPCTFQILFECVRSKYTINYSAKADFIFSQIM